MRIVDSGSIFNKAAYKIASFVVQIMSKMQLETKTSYFLLAPGCYKSKYNQERNA